MPGVRIGAVGRSPSRWRALDVMPGPYDARCLARFWPVHSGIAPAKDGVNRRPAVPHPGIAVWGAASRCGSGYRFPIDPVLRLQIGGSEIRADRKCRGSLVLRTVSRSRGYQHILDERTFPRSLAAYVRRIEGTPIREASRVRIAPRTFFELGVRCE